MKHLDVEILSDYVDGAAPPGVEEHLAECPSCREELAGLADVRSRVRTLPQLEPPSGLWSEIEARLPRGGRRSLAGLLSARRLRQVAGIAAVFVMGLGVGRFFWPAAEERMAVSDPPVAAVEGGERAALTVGDPSVALNEAMAEVRRRGLEYERALQRLESIAQRTGTPVPQMAEQELAVLDALVEASRRGVEVEPSDPILNAYLFAALDRRADVIRQAATRDEDADDRVVWR